MGEGEPLEDLDAQLRRTDPDRWLSSRYVADPLARADLVALYAYDGEIARAPRVASKPLLGEIRLTWWREALDAIYSGRAPRRHPVAEALTVCVRRRDLPRALLEAPLDARYDDLEPQPYEDEAALNAYLDAAYGSIMAAALRILDPAADAHAVRSAARAWGVARLSPHRLPAASTADRFARAHLAAARSIRLSAAAFPAVAHAALVRRPGAGELARRLTLTTAVLRGRL